MTENSDAGARASDLLFATLAEQVKTPFVQIAHAAELSRLNPGKKELDVLFDTISLTSQAAMKLIDGYLMSVQLQRGAYLPLEPVSLSSVLHDSMGSLKSYAAAHNCTIELAVSGKYGPVMARPEVVKTAIESLGYSFIEAAGAMGKKTRLLLMVRRSPHGITAGVFSDAGRLSSTLFKQAKILKGIARQPLGEFSAGSGAGVFVADALFDWLQSPMRVSTYKKLHGLSATMSLSKQLSLV